MRAAFDAESVGRHHRGLVVMMSRMSIVGLRQIVLPYGLFHPAQPCDPCMTDSISPCLSSSERDAYPSKAQVPSRYDYLSVRRCLSIGEYSQWDTNGVGLRGWQAANIVNAMTRTRPSRTPPVRTPWCALDFILKRAGVRHPARSCLFTRWNWDSSPISLGSTSALSGTVSSLVSCAANDGGRGSGMGVGSGDGMGAGSGNGPGSGCGFGIGGRWPRIMSPVCIGISVVIMPFGQAGYFMSRRCIYCSPY
jgi:hypothetical protein